MIAVLVPAYNTARFIEDVVKRILKQKIDKVIIVDDGSTDNTGEVIDKLSKNKKVIGIKHKKNRGHGGAQKTLLKEAIKQKADIAIFVHADGQHLPEEIPLLMKPILNKECDIVLGSRILGCASKGGMPLYKILGSKFLTALENFCFRMNLTTYHSGFRACNKKALNIIKADKLSNNFVFDSEYLVAAHKKRLKIKEVPVTTIYGEETSNVNSIKYGISILKLALKNIFNLL